jgi:hypothetical protein
VSADDASPNVFIGHPYAAIGKGEELRANLRALASLDEPVATLDIYRCEPRTDPDHVKLIAPVETRRLGGGHRIFHINGDEIDPVLRTLEAMGENFAPGRAAGCAARRNIVVPAWELPQFPQVWIEQIKRFDEVWAISHFVKDALAASGVESYFIGQSVDLAIRPFLSKRHFGLRESAFVFLVFLDFSSYASRKNPFAAIDMFRRLIAERPFDDIQLVLKMKGDRQASDDLAVRIDLPQDSFVVVNQLLSTYEQHSLIAACDCVVSLHRAEGFGRGPGEAMRLGRAALATGWSGNVDFMDKSNALLVDYKLIPVAAGDYPESEGQVWAEPDVEHAAWRARWALDNPADLRDMTRRARHDIVMKMGDRAVGLRMLERLRALDGRRDGSGTHD